MTATPAPKKRSRTRIIKGLVGGLEGPMRDFKNILPRPERKILCISRGDTQVGEIHIMEYPHGHMLQMRVQIVWDRLIQACTGTTAEAWKTEIREMFAARGLEDVRLVAYPAGKFGRVDLTYNIGLID